LRSSNSAASQSRIAVRSVPEYTMPWWPASIFVSTGAISVYVPTIDGALVMPV
jgi:hypothetical protein